MADVPLTIPQGSTWALIAEDVSVYNLETGVYQDLTTPDTILFYVKNINTGAVASVAGNQEGSTNNFNAEYTFSSSGRYAWQCVVTEGSAVGKNTPITVYVESSLDS